MAIKEDRFKNETFFSKTVGLISISGVLILSASVIYDYGYFFVFDVNIAEMPTTLSDHLRSSLNWIPEALFVILYMLVYGIAIDNEEQENATKQGERIEEMSVKEMSKELNRLRIMSQDFNRYRIIYQEFNSLGILRTRNDLRGMLQTYKFFKGLLQDRKLLRGLLQELTRSRRLLQKYKRLRKELWVQRLVLRFTSLFSFFLLFLLFLCLFYIYFLICPFKYCNTH